MLHLYLYRQVQVLQRPLQRVVMTDIPREDSRFHHLPSLPPPANNRSERNQQLSAALRSFRRRSGYLSAAVLLSRPASIADPVFRVIPYLPAMSLSHATPAQRPKLQ